MGDPCPYCQAQGVDHEEIRNLCRQSLYATNTILCGFNNQNYKVGPSEVFHFEACNWIEDRIRDGLRRILVMWPRGHLKTHMVTIGTNIWLHINNSETRGFVLHKASRFAEGMIGQMQSILLSRKFQHYFPEHVPALKRRLQNGKLPRWSDQEIELPRRQWHLQASITALGLESTVESSHVHVIIPDDLIDRKTAQSVPLMERAMDYVEHVDPLFDDPETGLLLPVGTYWPGGFYERIIEDPSFAKLIVGCYQDPRTAVLGMTTYGQPIYPEKFTLDSLSGIEQRMGTYKFAHQYLNDPISKGSATFKIEDVRYYEVSGDGSLRYFEESSRMMSSVRLSECFISQTADPAGESGDDSAITTLAYHHPTNCIFLLDFFSEPVPARRGALQYVKMAKKWKPKKAGIEKGAYELTWKPFLTQYCRENGITLRIEMLAHGGVSKSERIIEGFQAFVEAHRFYVLKRHTKVVQEMIHWNPERRNQRDNLLDALAYHPQLWQFKRPQATSRLRDGLRVDDDDRKSHILDQTGRLYGLGRGKGQMRAT